MAKHIRVFFSPHISKHAFASLRHKQLRESLRYKYRVSHLYGALGALGGAKSHAYGPNADVTIQLRPGLELTVIRAQACRPNPLCHAPFPYLSTLIYLVATFVQCNMQHVQKYGSFLSSRFLCIRHYKGS